MRQEEEMSLADFHAQLRKHGLEIKRLWDSVSVIYEQFAQEEEVFPEVCDQVRNAIRKMRVPVRSFYRLFDVPWRLPSVIVSHSLTLAITLRQIDELSDDLLIRFLLFRRTCRSSSQDDTAHHRDILNKLYALAKGYEDVLQSIDLMLMKVFAQEKAERQRIKTVIRSS